MDSIAKLNASDTNALICLADSPPAPRSLGTSGDRSSDVGNAVWHNIAIEFVPTHVIYNKGGVSHFNYLRDNILFVELHVRLMLGMLLRSPKLLWRLTQTQIASYAA